MNCDICGKSFSGLACYQQHEASEKHKNKVKLFQMRAGNGISQTQASSTCSIDLQVIHCDTCEIDFKGLPNFQKHVNSLQHVEMFNKKNENITTEDQLKGNPCESEYAFAKKETSPASFNSHMMPGPFAKCDVCKKEFSGPEPYQQHLASETHKKKCIRKELFSNKFNFDTVDSDKIVPFIKQEDSALKNDSTGTNEPYAECSFCNMQFSGPEPYQLHVDSESHQRKVAANLNSNIQSSRNNNTLNPYRCDICDKDFSGPIPHNDHMISKVHKKKIQNIELLKNFNNPTASQSDSTTQVPDYLLKHINSTLATANRAFYCEVCKKQSTGPIPHEAHLVSEGHRKNTRAAEMERNLKLKRESLMQHHLENAIELKRENLNELSREDQISSSTTNNYNDKANEVCKDFYISKDLILCDALKNIDVISEEDLNVTIFYPNDEIIFA